MPQTCPHCKELYNPPSGVDAVLGFKMHKVHCRKNPKSRWYVGEPADRAIQAAGIPPRVSRRKSPKEVLLSPPRVGGSTLAEFTPVYEVRQKKALAKTHVRDGGYMSSSDGPKIRFCPVCGFDLASLRLEKGVGTPVGLKVNFCPGCKLPVANLVVDASEEHVHA